MVNTTVVTAVSTGMTFNEMLDKSLAVVIPIIIFGMFGFMIYKAFKEPLDSLFSWMGDKWRGADGAQNPPAHQSKKFTGIILDNRADLYK